MITKKVSFSLNKKSIIFPSNRILSACSHEWSPCTVLLQFPHQTSSCLGPIESREDFCHGVFEHEPGTCSPPVLPNVSGVCNVIRYTIWRLYLHLHKILQMWGGFFAPICFNPIEFSLSSLSLLQNSIQVPNLVCFN